MKKYSADELFKIAYSHLQKKNYGKSAGLFEKLVKNYPNNLSHYIHHYCLQKFDKNTLKRF